MFGKVTGYKTNVHKSTIFLYISNEHMDTKIKTQYHLQSLQKILRYESDKTSIGLICCKAYNADENI